MRPSARAGPVRPYQRGVIDHGRSHPRRGGALLGALVPVLGVAVLVAFNAFYWLPIRGESPGEPT